MSGRSGVPDIAWAPDVVAALARTDPDRPAVVVGHEVLTYRALHDDAGPWAVALRTEAEPGDRVLLRFDRYAGLAVASLAATEAAVVPVLVDPAEPAERVRALAEAVGAVALCTDLPPVEGLALTVLEPTRGGEVSLEARRAPRPAPDAVGSISFTSGSTGTPKGIALPVADNQSVARILATLGVTDTEGWHLGVPFVGSAPGTDGALHSVFALGATLHGFDVRRQGLHEIADWLRTSRVGAFSAVPTAFRFLLDLLDPEDRFPDLELVASFGEPIEGELIDRFRYHLPPHARFLNVFGLTEARTIAALVVEPDEVLAPGPIAAGPALPGVELSIVGPDGAPVPPGDVGEIVVISDTCGLGYWGRPDLSEGVFESTGDGRRRVRTGDAGRCSADGVLEHLGRLDHVVKVSGHRVDLSEVEAALRADAGVADGVVVAVPDEHDDLRLRAAVVARSGQDLDPADLRRRLEATLSPWLVPDLVRAWAALPVVASGKVDRQAAADLLAADDGEGARQADVAAEPVDGDDPLARRLLALWCRELDRSDVGLDDDFFDVGGDSLRAARLFVAIDEELGYDRPISLLVHHRTVRRLAAVLPIERDVWNVLVPVRTDGDRAPLFVVHGGFGEVLGASSLADRLGPDQPVYALRAETLDGLAPRAATLPELAATYVGHLRSVWPDGPYRLYGYSLGGNVAFEMAAQLQRAGAEVSLLALGDSRVHQSVMAPEGRTEKVQRHLSRLRQLGPRAGGAYAIDVIRRQVRSRRGRAARRARQHEAAQRLDHYVGAVTYPVPVELRRNHVLFHLGHLVLEHEPTTPFEGRILHLRAERSVAHRGWDRLASHGVDVVEVRGRHPQMEIDPGLTDVARALRAALEAAADRGPR